jgi:hypothetical protein
MELVVGGGDVVISHRHHRAVVLARFDALNVHCLLWMGEEYLPHDL